MLTLLTVGTRQPDAVSDDTAAGYPDRLTATVDLLDRAVAQFIEDLRQDGVLDDTLVVVASDESHGSEKGDWIGSWGLGPVLAPESGPLPGLNEGTYGLVAVQASILDYLGQPIPPTVIGRSLFRDYPWLRSVYSLSACRCGSGLRYGLRARLQAVSAV